MKKGFTIIELLIVLTIVGVLMGIASLPIIRFRREQALQNTTNAVLTVINEARAKTLAGTENTNYSVRLEADRAILFRGATYQSAAPTNQIFLYESPVVLGTVALSGGGSTITFDRLRGTTAHHGTLQLQLPSGTLRTITVTATGTVARN
ncbi:MAG TPA: type II secretion system protein [Candidatus Paceibacterota bacterium]